MSALYWALLAKTIKADLFSFSKATLLLACMISGDLASNSPLEVIDPT